MSSQRKQQSAKSSKSLDSKKSKQTKPKKKATLAKGGLERAVPPVATTDPTARNTGKFENTKKELSLTFQGELDKKQSEHEREIQETLGKIHYLRKDNERQLRKQTAEYGITLDMFDELRQSIGHVKTQNEKLYHEMEESKDLHEKLSSELKAVQQKYTQTKDLMKSMKKEKVTWIQTREKLLHSESRCIELTKSNKRLKLLALKHRLDPNTDVRAWENEDVLADPASNSMEISTFTSPRRRLAVKGRFDNIGDLDSMRKLSDRELKDTYGIMHVNLDQMSPAYSRFYNRPMMKPAKGYYRPGVMLPRLV